MTHGSTDEPQDQAPNAWLVDSEGWQELYHVISPHTRRVLVPFLPNEPHVFEFWKRERGMMVYRCSTPAWRNRH